MTRKPATRINDPEYFKSRERLQKLEELIIEGEEAKTLLKFADKLEAQIERETLDALKKNNTDHEETAAFYKVAVRFIEMLRYAADTGDKKAKAFMDIIRNTQKAD